MNTGCPVLVCVCLFTICACVRESERVCRSLVGSLSWLLSFVNVGMFSPSSLHLHLSFCGLIAFHLFLAFCYPATALKRLPFMRNRSKEKDKEKAIYRRSMCKSPDGYQLPPFVLHHACISHQVFRNLFPF